MSGEDAFRFLRQDRRAWDLLVLDPPPFAKDRGSLERALRAYKDLNLWALCRARTGALVWTFSCSQHVNADLFQKVVFGAARDADASVQWLGRLGAGPDHPVHLDHPQGEYLNGLWMRVLRPGTPPRPKA
jgi:23S rRNA (cytosine1962-C5)-methyltransferase